MWIDGRVDSVFDAILKTLESGNFTIFFYIFPTEQLGLLLFTGIGLEVARFSFSVDAGVDD